MAHVKHVFIFGAGFSKPAGMPLATDLLPLLVKEPQSADQDMLAWLDDLRGRLAWLSGPAGQQGSFALNIEEVFHHAHFDIEALRLRQQLARAGGRYAPRTLSMDIESTEAWLSYLEEDLRDVIDERDKASDLSPINRWAQAVREGDAVLTFNYDTLVERALTGLNKPWNHGIESDVNKGIPVHKLHGSIDWIVAHRSEQFSGLDLLFDAKNANESEDGAGRAEDDCRLWRCRSAEQRSQWIGNRALQAVPDGACPRTIGIAGLGAYKPLHRIPGLGRVWAHGMRALYEADLVVVVGFSMSDFDAMAQMQFAAVAQSRWKEGRVLRVVAVDPSIKDGYEQRFQRVFREFDFVKQAHETIDWANMG